MKEITVRHLVIDSLAGMIRGDPYGICLNPECEVVYFNAEGQLFLKKDIKVPIGYKKDADPRYVCYCSKVTEEQIIDAVRSGGARNIKDVIRLTGAMRNANCEMNNPLGECCSTSIQEVIHKALGMEGEDEGE